ncbi:hypothetical protein D3C87_1890210 [compost metagenome]
MISALFRYAVQYQALRAVYSATTGHAAIEVCACSTFTSKLRRRSDERKLSTKSLPVTGFTTTHSSVPLAP